MSTSRPERRLAAILIADAVGYTRLTRADETGTRTRLRSFLDELFTPMIAEYHGRIVKTMGDGLLVEFVSAVDAVECAACLQAGLAERNAAEPPDRCMAFRIGINVGDVIVEDGDIHGDGVNVAARLEQLAEPGGVWVSGSVHEEVHRRLPLRFARLGPQKVRNVADPIVVYRLDGVLVPGQAVARSVHRRRPVALFAALVLVLSAAGFWWFDMPRQFWNSTAQSAMALPEKPSIAVMPLDNLSADPEQAYLAEALTQAFAMQLAGFPNLFVISSASTERYRGVAVDARQVAEELGVRYLLDGSLRRSGDALRISARLVDTSNGALLWGETYDRPFADLLALEDEVTREVASRLTSSILSADFDDRSRTGASDAVSYDLFLRGWQLLHMLGPENAEQASRLFKEALEIAPDYARALAGLALVDANAARFGWTADSEAAYGRAHASIERALQLDSRDEVVQRVLGSVMRLQSRYDEAIVAYEKALALAPSDPDTLLSLGLAQALSGRLAAATKSSALAMRLNPYPPPVYSARRGMVRYLNGEYAAAIDDMERFKALNPNIGAVYNMWLAASHAQLGREADAQAYADALLTTVPRFTVQGFLKQWNPQGIARERITEGLRKAGLPDGSSG